MKLGHTLFCFSAALVISAAVVSAKITPICVEQTVQGQFPASLAFSPINSGEARVMINIDADGKLADLMVTGYSHPAFATEAVGLLKQWRYSPAAIDGIPIGVRAELRINFVAKGRVISLSAIDTTGALLQNMIPQPLFESVCGPAELDNPIEALQMVSPPTPGKTEPSRQLTATTVVDFYVDEQGQIRMPVVTESTNETYAQATVSVLNQWRFSAPTRRGKPVAVRVQQKFIFPGDS